LYVVGLHGSRRPEVRDKPDAPVFDGTRNLAALTTGTDRGRGRPALLGGFLDRQPACRRCHSELLGDFLRDQLSNEWAQQVSERSSQVKVGPFGHNVGAPSPKSGGGG
jgi:hypothetical protein